MGRLADLHRARCRVCGWTCSEGGCQPDLCSDVTRPGIPRKAGVTRAREQVALAWRLARTVRQTGLVNYEWVMRAHAMGAIPLIERLFEQDPDPLAQRRGEHFLWLARTRCNACGRVGTTALPHTEDCDAMPF